MFLNKKGIFLPPSLENDQNCAIFTLCFDQYEYDFTLDLDQFMSDFTLEIDHEENCGCLSCAVEGGVKA
jgi:hypothetical protein